MNKPAAHILHGVPTRVTYNDVTEVLENSYSDHHLEAAFISQLKRRNQLVGVSLEEFATATNQLAHHAHIELPEHLISKEATCAFANRVREQDIIQQLLLEGKKTLNKTLNQTLELETADIAAKTPSSADKWRPGHSGGASPLQQNEETTDSLHTGTVGAPATFERTVPMNTTKKKNDARETNGNQQEGMNGAQETTESW
jgi:hypothetical protein